MSRFPSVLPIRDATDKRNVLRTTVANLVNAGKLVKSNNGIFPKEGAV